MRVDESIRRTMIVLAAVLALAVCPVLMAETPQKSTESEPEVTPVSFAGLQIFIDEEGKIRQPSAKESAALSSALREAMSRVIGSKSGVVSSADGVTTAEVGTDYLKFLNVHIHEDGTVSSDCVTGPERAIASILKPQAIAPQAEEE